MTMQEIDRAAALAAISAQPKQYPVLRYLSEDIKARLEPLERLGRYGDLALELITATQDAIRTMAREMSFGREALADRLEVALLLNGLNEAVRQQERGRAQMEEARYHRMDADDAATGGRSLEDILDNERRLEERVALLECRMAEGISIKRCGTADGPALPAGGRT